MLKVLSTSMMREADQYTIDNLTTLEDLIMKAGRAVFQSHKFMGKTLIIIGKGNNGGDGLALANILKDEGHDVEILQLFKLSSPILLALLSTAIEKHIPVFEYSDDFNFIGYDTFVDAIFGIGFKGEINEPVKSVINKINSLETFTISIDINTGLDADTGKTNLAVLSDLTVALGYLKPGHFLNDAKDYIYSLACNNIGIPYEKETYYLYTGDDLKQIFKKRKYNSNKSTYGYVGIFGGSYKYSGSIKLSSLGEAALRLGCGVTRIIAPQSIADSILPYILESTLYPIESDELGNFVFNEGEIEEATKGLSALAFGMGISDTLDNIKILEYILNNYDKKLLIDADGINTLAKLDLELINNSYASIVLTPHVKEFSRLINVSVGDILLDPIKYAKEFTLKYKCTLLLKGTTTIVSNRGKIYLISTGSPALSKGGSGDILSGVIVGIMGYNNSIDSTLAGAFLFGLAGDILNKKYGSYTSIPRDVIEVLKELLKNY